MTERLEEARQRVETETDRSLELMRRLRQTESLAIAGKLCSSIAHEVGTPLNIIAGTRRAHAPQPSRRTRRSART